MNCRDLPGDSWRIRHDTGKLAIVNECLISKLPVECDVYGLFAGPTDSLAELKFISAGVTWFPRGVDGKGTDRRAARLSGEYKRALAKLDTKFHRTPKNQTGPLVNRFLSYGTLQGLVVGPCADGS